MTVGAPRSLSVPEHPLWLADLGLSTFVALNIATTGPDPDRDQILDLGLVRFVNGRPASVFESLLNADLSPDPSVLERTGITEAELHTAPHLPDIADDLLRFIGGYPLVGIDADWNLAFLRKAAQRSERVSGSFAFIAAPVLDVSLVARTFWPELPAHTIPALTAHFGLATSKLRRSREDASTTGALLMELIVRLPGRVWPDLAQDLYRLIGSTTHRSRFFFAALAGLAKGAAPARGADRIEPQSATEAIDESLETLLGPNGRFENALGFFESRPVQVSMAKAVEYAFDKGDILLVEAPTGVGKSLAYLVPALRWALEDDEGDRQVIVSSHTRMLQEQLHRKDIREIRQAIDKPFRSAVLKGRNNYLCRRRLKMVLREAGERLSELDRIQIMPLLRWAETTTTGDISEIGAFNPKVQSFLWSQISSDSMTCAGGACGANKGDFHRLAQERASRAHLVFVNHALLFADLSRLTAGPSDKRRFVLDEAHQIEKAAVSAMSSELSPVVLRNTLAPVVDERSSRGILSSLLHAHKGVIPDELRTTIVDLLESGRSLHPAIRQHFTLLGEKVMAAAATDTWRSAKIRFRTGDRWQREADRTLNPLHIQWLDFAGRFSALVDQLADQRAGDRLPPEVLVELRSAVDKMQQLSEQIDQVLADDDQNFVRWLEAGQNDYGVWCAIFMAPVCVGEQMKDAFWSAVGSAVLTSATLSAAGDFSLVRSALGLSDSGALEVREQALPSPYDLQRQMRMIVPSFLPDPRGNDQSFVQDLGDLVVAIAEQSRRATVVLCTSNDMVDRLTAALTAVAQRTRRPLFSQTRSSSAPELLAEYRKHRDGILIGAATFWEGIDLVGDALEILVVSKIPFDVPTDPWVAARCERLQEAGRDSFAEFSVPVATLRMKQGIGRLIRHQTDRGVAILADPRLFHSRYGPTIRSALPGNVELARSRREVLDSIRRFFDD